MTALVRCRHLATLGADVEVVGACFDLACPPPLTESLWSFAGSRACFHGTLAELADGFSRGGALLRVAERRRSDGPLLLADGEQVAAAASAPGIRLRALGGGSYALAAGTVAEPVAWTEVPAGTLLLLDSCGVTTTHLIQPRGEAIA